MASLYPALPPGSERIGSPPGRHGGQQASEGIAYVLGRSEMHWYRLCQSLGRASIVGTTLKTEMALPPI
jgi:hypothetical protein